MKSIQLDLCSVQANLSAPIIRRANYVSGRDQKSVKAFSDLLSTLSNARTTPEEVARVRDPVLSDGYFKDVSGRCWRQNEGDQAANMVYTIYRVNRRLRFKPLTGLTGPYTIIRGNWP